MISLEHNLLFNSSQHSVGKTDINFAENFKLRTLFGRFATNTEDLDYFIDILLNPLTNISDIVYRRDILNDFRNNLVMFEKMEQMFNRIVSIKNENFKIRALSIGGRIETVIQRNSESLKKILVEVKWIANNISKMSAESEGLKKLIKRMKSINNSEELDKLIAICDTFDHKKDDNKYDLLIELSETAKIKQIDIICNNNGLKSNVSKNNIDKTQNGASYTYIALKSIADSFVNIEKNIYNEFCNVVNQLSFYNIALNYIKYMQNNGYILIYPEVNYNNELLIRSLRDAILCFELPYVVENDVFCAENGMIIYGENNSGKTVYLRSLGTAQLLFQAGLPILAESASLPIKHGLYSLFSSAENQNINLDILGRFEEEVKSIKDLFDKIDQNSLVLLNEPFQTTDYEEGGEYLYYILKSMSEIGTKWFIVTHLNRLIDKYREDESIRKVKILSNHKSQIL